MLPLGRRRRPSIHPGPRRCCSQRRQRGLLRSSGLRCSRGGVLINRSPLQRRRQPFGALRSGLRTWAPSARRLYQRRQARGISAAQKGQQLWKQYPGRMLVASTRRPAARPTLKARWNTVRDPADSRALSEWKKNLVRIMKAQGDWDKDGETASYANQLFLKFGKGAFPEPRRGLLPGVRTGVAALVHQPGLVHRARKRPIWVHGTATASQLTMGRRECERSCGNISARIVSLGIGILFSSATSSAM